MSKSPPSIRSRVEAGARWLDENFPGWEERIDLETLHLSRADSCICGQVFADKPRRVDGYKDSGYEYAYANLFSEANSWITALVGSEPMTRVNRLRNFARREASADRANAVSVALGFNLGEGQSFTALQKAWVQLLKDREEARSSVSP